MNWDLVRDRLQLLIAARETNPNALAEICGVPQPTISRFLNGDTNFMQLDNLWTIAKALDAEVSEIIGERPMELDEKVRRVTRIMQTLPEYKKDVLVGSAEALVRDETPKRAAN